MDSIDPTKTFIKKVKRLVIKVEIIIFCFWHFWEFLVHTFLILILIYCYYFLIYNEKRLELLWLPVEMEGWHWEDLELCVSRSFNFGSIGNFLF